MTGSSGANTGSVGGSGRLERDGEKASVVFRRLLRHPINDVWAAITDPVQLESWGMVRVTREEAQGGRVEMAYANGVHATGRVLEWSPPRVYEYEWNLPPGPNLPDGEASVVRWELSPVEEGTLVVLTHRRLSRQTAEVFVRGLTAFLARLAAFMDGTPMPDPPWGSGSVEPGHAG